MPRDLRKYLYDIDQACLLLKEFTGGKSFADYSTDAMLRSAVERQFEIIGEALGQALRTEPTLELKISHCARIIAFRNRLFHGYAAVSDELVWGVVQTHLDRLHREVSELMRRTD